MDAILQDAAAHEADAVSCAVAVERAACAEVFGSVMRCAPELAAALAVAARGGLPGDGQVARPSQVTVNLYLPRHSRCL